MTAQKKIYFFLFLRKKLKFGVWMKYVAIFAVRGTVHSYEIILVHLISVLLVGQKIEISLPLGLQCSISVSHLMYYITKHTRGNFWGHRAPLVVSKDPEICLFDIPKEYFRVVCKLPVGSVLHLEIFLADFEFLSKLLVGWCNSQL